MGSENLQPILLELQEQLGIYITAFCTLLLVDLEVVNCELQDFLVRLLAISTVFPSSLDNRNLILEIVRLIVACQQMVIERKAFEDSLVP